MTKTTRSSESARWLAYASALLAVFHMTCAHGGTVGRWSFGGTAGGTVPVGTVFPNIVDGTKFPAKVVNRYNDDKSTGHLSSISTFDDAPFNACRESRFASDVTVETSLHFDGNPGNDQGCPLYIDDPDGELELRNFTFEFFVRRPAQTSPGVNQYQMYVSKVYHNFGSGQGTYYNGLYRDRNAVWCYHWCCVTNDAGDVGYGDITLGSHAIEDGKWHHIALSVDGDNKKVAFYIDRQEVRKADLPGPPAYAYSGGGTAERHPWVVGNHELYGGYSWNGDIAEMRISDEVLQTEDMLRQGSSVPDGGTVMWLPLDDGFDALGWNREQPADGAFEDAVAAALAEGKASFGKGVSDTRVTGGVDSARRRPNNGCLSLNGGYVDLAITPFRPEMYDAVTIEFFFKAGFAKGSWLALVTCRHDKLETGNKYYGNRLPFCFQENGDRGVNCRTDTPEKADASISVPRDAFDGAWHHIALTVTHGSGHATQTVTAYFDYERIGSISVAGVFSLDDWHFLRFGHKDNSGSVMQLDEFRISRGALPVSAFMRQVAPAGTNITIR